MYKPATIDFNGFLEQAFPEETTRVGKYGAKSVTIQVTDSCNLRCTYCYQIDKHNNFISIDRGKKFIDQILFSDNTYCNASQSAGMALEFIGGEPLLAIDIIQELTEYVFKRMTETNHPWLYRTKISICSNGTLYFEPKVQEYIRRYKDLLSFSISIDGNKILHDKCRVFPDGSGSYDIAMAAVRHYRENYNSYMETKMTMSPDNIMYTFDAIKSLIENGYTDINFNCVYEEGWTKKHANILYNELKKIGDYILADSDRLNNLYLSRFRRDHYIPLTPDDNTNFCGGLGNMIAVNYTGNIYPCLRYMESSLGNSVPPVIIGDEVTGIVQTDKYSKIVETMKSCTRRSQSDDTCFYCPIGKGCGYCSAYNYQYFKKFGKRTTFTCDMHKAEALANAYYWNKFFLQENIDDCFIVHIPKEWAIEIIDEEEYNMIMALEQACRDRLEKHNNK